MSDRKARPWLRVLTYNLHGCVGADGVRDVERIARVIRALEPDIAGLQEVDCRVARVDGLTQLEALAAATGMEAIAGPTIREGDGFYGNALLSRFPFGEVSHFDLSYPRREPRAVLSAKVIVDGVDLRCLVTHFGLRARERDHQARHLLEQVGTGPVVVMGDFNEWRPRAATMARIDAALGATRAVRSFPARFPVLKLDRIWVRPECALVDITARADSLARVASDHLPLVATIDRRLL